MERKAENVSLILLLNLFIVWCMVLNVYLNIKARKKQKQNTLSFHSICTSIAARMAVWPLSDILSKINWIELNIAFTIQIITFNDIHKPGVLYRSDCCIIFFLFVSNNKKWFPCTWSIQTKYNGSHTHTHVIKINLNNQHFV